jgi:hypothetical protein
VDAVRASGAALFAIGLADDVNHAVLDELAGASGGQATYVSAADSQKVKENFLSIGDRLRRHYVLQYTSQAPGDDKAHPVSVKVTAADQTAEAKGSFTSKRLPLTLDVRGIANAATVSGSQRVEVAVTGGAAQQVELLVDDKPRASANTSPYVLTWDTSQDTPGLHKVTLRARDATGGSTEKDVVLQVLGPPTAVPPPPVAAPAPTAVPTAVAAPAPPPAPASDPLPALLAGITLLALAGLGTGAVVIARRRVPAPAPVPVAAPAPAPPSNQTMYFRTEPEAPVAPAVPSAPEATMFTRKTLTADQTFVNPRFQPPVPAVPVPVKPTLRLSLDGTEKTIPLDRAELLLGRHPTSDVVIRDPQASSRHARITAAGDDYWVEDLGSTNGTFVNGEPLKDAPRRQLRPGDRISIGHAALTFERSAG